MPSVNLKRNTNGLFYVLVYDSTRTPRAKAVPTGTKNKRNAETHRNRIEREIAEGRFDPWRPRLTRALGSLTYDEASKHFISQRSRLRPATIAAYQTALDGVGKLLAPGLRVDGVIARHLNPYVCDMDVSDATRRHRRRHLRAFFRWCIVEGLCEINPLDGIHLPKAGRALPAFLRSDGVKKLTEAMEKAGDLWLRDVVLLALCTGLRRGEICALRWSGIDLTPGRETLTIRSGAHGFETKNGNDIVRPLMSNALQVVQRLAEERRARGDEEDGPVLRSVKGAALNPHFVSRRFKHYVRTVHLPEEVHFHSLRHTCATWLVQSGAPLPVVAKMLGHSSIHITQIYTHMEIDDLRAFGKSAFGAGID